MRYRYIILMNKTLIEMEKYKLEFNSFFGEIIKNHLH